VSSTNGPTTPGPTSPTASAAGPVTIGGDLTVNRMGFGAMRITGPRILGEPKNPEEARRVLRRAVDLGINLIDTADSYGPNVSERLIGETLSPYPEGLVIATKGGLTRRRTGSWPNDARPEHLRKACEGSLARLRLDRIDLYQLHAPDPKVPFAESVGALAELRGEGKIRHVGLSNVSLEELREAQAIVPVASVQNYFHVARREAEEVLDACEADGIAYLPWRPLDGGALAGRRGAAAALAEVADVHGATPGQIALAWLLARSPVMVPIPGTGSVAHLEENVAAAGIRLTEQEFDQIGSATTR
jgi:aryl-alcohol dehydrogenase-like predicted oxidoreductase